MNDLIIGSFKISERSFNTKFSNKGEILVITSVPRPIKQNLQYTVYDFMERIEGKKDRLLFVCLAREYERYNQKRVLCYNLWGKGLTEDDVRDLTISLLTLIKQDFNIDLVDYIDFTIWREMINPAYKEPEKE